MKAASRADLFRVLPTVIQALEAEQIPYAIGGGLAAEAYRLRETANDIDVFVMPVDAPHTLDALERAGFAVWIQDPHWLYKAQKDQVEVDVIFEPPAAPILHLDAEAFRRVRTIEVDGVCLKIMPPEDFVVLKVLAARPESPKHWLDAMSLLLSEPLDWRYLVERSRGHPRPLLRAIIQAHDEGAPVPLEVFLELARPLVG